MQLELKALATDDDWAAYHAIRRRVLFELRGNGAAYNANHPDERRASHYPFLLLDGDVPVGVIRIDIHGATATFRRVAIRDDMQRRGYGRRLLEEAERFSRREGCARIESFVDPDAIGFYERCGFSRASSATTNDSTTLMIKPLGSEA